MKNFTLVLIFSFFSFLSFAQKNIDSDSNYIGSWSKEDYKKTFLYNPSPIPFSFTDDMVSAHFSEVWQLDIFSKFPTYPRFNAQKKENPTDEDVVIYLNLVSKWLNENPSFYEYLEKNKGY